MIRSVVIVIGTLLLAPAVTLAHDTWVQSNTHLIRTGDAVHIDLMLGNHGNDHRDFKLASKLDRDAIQTFEVLAPDGKKYDLKPDLVDLGYAPKEGFYTSRFITGKAGLYIAAQVSDKVVNHGKPVRVVRSAKSYFAACDSLDKPLKELPGFDKAIGHKLELVSVTNSVTAIGPGMPIKLRLLFEGKALPGQKVSFVPRGTTLKDGFDTEHERTTDKDGSVAYTPKAGTYYLAVVHYPQATKGENYESVLYTATLTVFVPQICPCCGE